MTKPTKWHVRPAKTQISLGFRPVWSESLLSAWGKLGSLATYWVHSEDSDLTGRKPRLIWVFAGRTCHFVGFVMRWLKRVWFFFYTSATQADLSLRWVHMPFCWFCYALVHISDDTQEMPQSWSTSFLRHQQKKRAANINKTNLTYKLPTHGQRT